MLVSVIIPTLNRPELLTRALRSVLNQTYANIEVVVVIDGPDARSVNVLKAVRDHRVRTVYNPRSLTAAGARNRGVDHAKGDWIAFLDDDDEWLPDKLEKQMKMISSMDDQLITCLSRVCSPYYRCVKPKHIFDNSIPLDEYLFDCRSPFHSQGFIQTSSYLLPRSLFNKIRFAVDNPHDDWDFILRLSKCREVRIQTVPEVLVVIHVDEDRPSLSNNVEWAASLRWIESIKLYLTPRAYAALCLGVVGSRAAAGRDYAVFFHILRLSFLEGSPRMWSLVAYIARWIIPRAAPKKAKRLLMDIGAYFTSDLR
jgi:glycosyltransferase involved in cell wall biosynthesis